MHSQKKSDETVINGFFTKIVSLMFVCSAFISSVDVTPAHARIDSGTASAEKSNVTADEVYLESSILPSSESVTVFGSTIPHAELEIKHPSGVTYTVTADAAGHFKLSALPMMNTGDIIDIIASAHGLKISEHLQYNR